MESNELSQNAMGGTEIMLKRIHDSIDSELLKEFQIIPSRVRDLKEDKLRILYLHDLPGDPESDKALQNEGHRNFHRLVFVSNWQLQAYISHYNIPWSKCVVIQNSINPIERELPWKLEDDETIRLIYHSTPHRGLNILVPVFKKLVEKYPNLHLDVYSSFKLYGWEQRDEPYKPIFDQIVEHPNMTYHGTVNNETIRHALRKSHIFAYPSIWTETSCLCLIEAMSAGLVCIHPNLGALYETAMNLTSMYQWQENPSHHAGVFYNILDYNIQELNSEATRTQITNQKACADVFYNWNTRKVQWEGLLRSLLKEPREFPKAEYVYRT